MKKYGVTVDIKDSIEVELDLKLNDALDLASKYLKKGAKNVSIGLIEECKEVLVGVV